MGSKSSTAVYIRNDILKKVDEYLKTEDGKKIAIRDPKKALSYIVTKWLEEHS